ncbi:unnamed protein product [Prorocentrum cordatum]|uniref:Protein kinase domain-containing protein n=1 Tax=Prorocentrum cordatum TaxID=2364126 RepID=A0ABN9UQB7_9DINO|nr:unnamed protein product [Polarella glacialis]
MPTHRDRDIFQTGKAQPPVSSSHPLRAPPNIVVMAGAGLSVSAGIPDFRSPGTGLYDNLHRYGLPHPEAIFELSFFRDNPAPFYPRGAADMLCKELWPGQYRPTPAHYFLALLEQKGLLQRCYTQNIDSLETTAGLSRERLVAAHGNFDTASCIDTGRKVPPDEVRQAVMGGAEACEEMAQRHGGLVKPDIVFFGESLPERFFRLQREDFALCDLLLIFGTSLQVHPFAGLAREPRPGVPRVLVNRERVGEDEDGLGELQAMLGIGRASGLQFDHAGSQDVFVQGECDDAVEELVRLLGWQSEFLELLESSADSAWALQPRAAAFSVIHDALAMSPWEQRVWQNAPAAGGGRRNVKRVLHAATSEVFAMKIIASSQVRERDASSYLNREVSVQLKARHPNILRLLSYFEDLRRRACGDMGASALYVCSE